MSSSVAKIDVDCLGMSNVQDAIGLGRKPEECGG